MRLEILAGVIVFCTVLFFLSLHLILVPASSMPLVDQEICRRGNTRRIFGITVLVLAILIIPAYLSLQ